MRRAAGGRRDYAIAGADSDGPLAASRQLGYRVSMSSRFHTASSAPTHRASTLALALGGLLLLRPART